MYSSAMKNVVIPLYDFATGNPTRKYMNELEKSQWFKLKKIRRIQETKLKSLIKHAYETVPYYHRIFRKHKLALNDFRSVDDLAKFPILRRDRIRDRFDALISRGYPRKNMVYGSTGGSTGEPIRFYTTQENRCWSMAARYVAWRWAGFEVGDKFAQIFGSPLDRPVFQSIKGKIEGKIKRRISINAFKMSEETLKRFVNEAKSFKPKVIYGYAGAVYLLAKFIEEKRIEGICPKSVIIDSMSLYEDEVKLIERAFGCNVWWNYHNRENGTFGSECSEHNGYHLFAQNFVFEFVRKGELISPGEAGAVVVTDLTNYAMPFIRYDVGDVGTMSNEMCVCGRGLPILSKLLGRTSEILVSAIGEFVSVPFYAHRRFFATCKIRQYQIVQENPNRILVRIIPDKDYTPEDTRNIRKVMLSLLGDLEIEVRLVDSIALSKSGKRQVVLRKFPIRFS